MKKLNYKIIILVIIIVVSIVLIVTSFITKHKKINSTLDDEDSVQKIYYLAEVNSSDYPTTQADYNFAELVKEKTQGRVAIEVYTDATLGEETEVIEKLQYGTLGFARVSIAPVAEYSDALNALMLPYLYKDSEHMWKVLDGSIGQNMLASVEEAGLIGLSWYDSGARSFYSSKDISTLEEFKQTTFRVQTSSMMFAVCEALGCIPKTLPESDIVDEVKRGKIDGAENNLLTYYSYEQYKVCPYYIMDEHTRIPDILVGSKEALQDVSEEDMKIIRECAKEAEVYERDLWEKKEKEVMELLRNEGVIFIQLSDEEREKMKTACEGLYSEFAGDYDETIYKINEIAE
ncbi:MAG: TRAP transporter substrate-binding protein DctP [Lachnotalea sp.]